MLWHNDFIGKAREWGKLSLVQYMLMASENRAICVLKMLSCYEELMLNCYIGSPIWRLIRM